jgi:hypothetical protein
MFEREDTFGFDVVPKLDDRSGSHTWEIER